tara:strand:+ start:79537 stop:79638 length:102 start_codon:yes stop_codon:yes gene_type:complete
VQRKPRSWRSRYEPTVRNCWLSATCRTTLIRSR